MTAPKPPIALDVDLREYLYMPLHVVRLRDSEFATSVSDAAFRSAIMLWCASWHQVPAGSLPNNDKSLSNLAGFGRTVKSWLAVKDEAMYGWVLCDDGRWYHPVICEVANESWVSRQRYAYKKFAERIRKSNDTRRKNKDSLVVTPSFEVWTNAGRPYDWLETSDTLPPEDAHLPMEDDELPPEFLPQNALREDEGKVEGNISVRGRESNITEQKQKALSAAAATDKVSKAKNQTLESAARFEEFWAEYPNKVAKVNAEKAFRKIDFKKHPFETIMAALAVFKQWEGWLKDKGQFVPMPSTWLNQQRWTDDLSKMQAHSPQQAQPPRQSYGHSQQAETGFRPCVPRNNPDHKNPNAVPPPADIMQKVTGGNFK